MKKIIFLTTALLCFQAFAADYEYVYQGRYFDKETSQNDCRDHAEGIGTKVLSLSDKFHLIEVTCRRVSNEGFYPVVSYLGPAGHYIRNEKVANLSNCLEFQKVFSKNLSAAGLVELETYCSNRNTVLTSSYVETNNYTPGKLQVATLFSTADKCQDFYRQLITQFKSDKVKEKELYGRCVAIQTRFPDPHVEYALRGLYASPILDRIETIESASFSNQQQCRQKLDNAAKILGNNKSRVVSNICFSDGPNHIGYISFALAKYNVVERYRSRQSFKNQDQCFEEADKLGEVLSKRKSVFLNLCLKGKDHARKVIYTPIVIYTENLSSQDN